MSSNLKLNQIFEGYDNSEPVPAGLGNSDLARLSKESLNKNIPNKGINAKTKKDGLILIAKKVESAINALLPNDKKINLDITFTSTIVNSSSPGGKKGIFVQNKTLESKFGNVSMNLNLQRLSKLPALEIYSVMYKSLYENAFKINLENDEILDFGNKSVDSDNLEKNKKQKISSKDKAIECLAGYLNKFLPKYFEGKFKKFENISLLVATQIVNEMGEEDIDKILSVFFKFEKLDSKAIDFVDKFLGSAEVYRGAHLLGKATELMLDPDKEVVALNYLEQYQELLSESTKSKFKEAVNSGSKSLNSIKDFCANYANQILRKSGINSSGIEITFNAEGELGTFYDTMPPKLNINLSKINSISELALTLSHELTHVVDACINTTKGKYNSESGGLEGGISEDIDNFGLSTSDPAYKLLKELKGYCYRVNKNERHARIGELGALRFIGEMAKDPTIDKSGELKGQLSTSIATYIRYQEKTILKMSELSELKIDEFRGRLKGLGKLPKEVHDMINQRIDYLEQNLKEGLCIEAEKASIEEARKILEEQRREEEKHKKDSETMKDNDIYYQKGE